MAVPAALNKYKRPLFTGFLLGMVVFFLLFFLADFQEVTRALAAIDLRLLPLILLLAPLNYLFRYVKWNYYLQIAGIKPAPKMNRYIFLSGLSMTVTPGKVGELLKCYLLKEHMNAPVSQTSSIVMAERITDALAMVVLATVGSLAYPYGKVVVPLAAGILLFTVALLHVEGLFQAVAKPFIKRNLFQKGVSFLRNFQRSAKTLFTPQHLLVAVGIGVVSWGFESFLVYLAVQALGGEISMLGSIFVVSFSSLLGALSFLPGGLGVAEGSIMAILVLTGLGKETAAAATVITRFSTLWLGVALGIIGLALVQKAFLRGEGRKTLT